MERVQSIINHLTPAAEASLLSTQPTAGREKSPDDIVVVCAVRTPITKAKRGGFKDTPQEDMLAAVLKAILDRTKIDPKLVDDICVGNVLPPGGGATVARMAQFYAGFPDTTSVYTLNRQCSSGLQACANIAAALASGTIKIGIGAGVESMTLNYGAGAMPTNLSSKMNDCQLAADCMIPMGQTSELVASNYNVSREKQDKLALESHQKAAAAQAKGLYNDEIVPVKVIVKDGDAEKEVVVSKDDGVRASTTYADLAKLRPAFKEDGTTTAGNSSQVSDGAAAVLMMKRKTANQLGLPVQGVFRGFATAGVPPNVMGIGPAFAIPKVLEQTKLKISDIDIFEINEAFASQAVYCVEKLGIDYKKLNPKGGAIALGHPLGCTGARQIATLLPELKRTKGRYGVVSMCIGSGMGAAAVFESE